MNIEGILKFTLKFILILKYIKKKQLKSFNFNTPTLKIIYHKQSNIKKRKKNKKKIKKQLRWMQNEKKVMTKKNADPVLILLSTIKVQNYLKF